MDSKLIDLDGIHHVAYRCKDAEQTVNWYIQYLDMSFVLAIAEDKVPSTGEPDPYMHVFLDAGNDNVLAFFELPTKDDMQFHGSTPSWVQHIAFNVGSMDQLLAAKTRLLVDGHEVLGPIDHRLFQSIYFFDPNGHRLELVFNTANAEMMSRVDSVKWDMLKEWSKTKKAPRHTSWLHEKPTGDTARL